MVTVLENTREEVAVLVSEAIAVAPTRLIFVIDCGQMHSRDYFDIVRDVGDLASIRAEYPLTGRDNGTFSNTGGETPLLNGNVSDFFLGNYVPSLTGAQRFNDEIGNAMVLLVPPGFDGNAALAELVSKAWYRVDITAAIYYWRAR